MQLATFRSYLSVTKRQSDVPVFLLYAGILHAIGLALLLPMLITLPGPVRESATPSASPAPKNSPIDVIVLPPPQPLTDAGPEQTSALPSAPHGGEGTAVGRAAPVTAERQARQDPANDGAIVAPAAPPQAAPATLPREPAEVEPSQAEPLEAETPLTEEAEAAPQPKDAVVAPEAEPRTTPAIER